MRVSKVRKAIQEQERPESSCSLTYQGLANLHGLPELQNKRQKKLRIPPPDPQQNKKILL